MMSVKPVSRRRFLKIDGISLVAIYMLSLLYRSTSGERGASTYAEFSR
jgi:hypothetical protein